MGRINVLLVGLDPDLIDFSDPAYAMFPGMTAEKVRAGLDRDVANLAAQGYGVDRCLVDHGATAEATLRERLGGGRYDCVVVGAGVRMIAKNTALFEKLVDAVRARAPGAKLCFNTGLTDSADAVRRWFPTP